MCGILATPRHIDISLSLKNTAHRGPDKTDVFCDENYTLGFHRLSINDLSDEGNQPFVYKHAQVVCNGEIYNFKSLMEIYRYSYRGGSDCQIIPRLLEAEVPLTNICNSIDGVFAFAGLYHGKLIAARDPVGIRPLFYGKTRDDEICFCSEIKGLKDICVHDTIKHFPPGHCYIDSQFISYEPYNFICNNFNGVYEPRTINALLTQSVNKRLMSDRKIGYFLSGGLDSSLIASIASKYCNKRIKTFSIGYDSGDTPDLINAKIVAKHLNTIHTEVKFSFEDALKVIPEVIYALETYDCTTIRAAVPMFILSKFVKNNTDIKVLLSGEGADELFGGYLYLQNAPDKQNFQEETHNLIKNVHMFDALRADRCTAYHGLELRVPFFDKTFLQYILSIDPGIKHRKGIEKWILRKSFEGYIPESVLWRQKNGMSDAVGYDWVSNLRSHTENLNLEHREYSKNSPLTNEELWYRNIYSNLFGTIDATEDIWRPKWTHETDPSATKLNVFST